jgi:predicted RNA-binding protein YlxR (DUF448 family)/ribosomal protein L7Ae-like RNA K-turn-binding protein
MKAEPDGHSSERMCIVTREVMDEAQLVRFVRSPEGEAVPDLLRKLPGRGVWVGLSRARVQEAVAKRLFSKGFGAETKAPDDLAARLGLLLRRQATGYVSLAKKAGEAVAGTSKVEESVGKGQVRLILHAREASAEGCRKIDKLAAPDTKIINLLGVDELDLAFGRSNVIHAAIKRGQLAEKLLLAVQRIERYDATGGASSD